MNITPALVQNEIHPYYQENDVIPFIQEKGIVVQGWYPLGGRGHTAELLGDETIKGIAAAHGVSSAQVILRWNLQKGVVVIPGSSNPDHIKENTELYHFTLTEDEMNRINALDRKAKGEGLPFCAQIKIPLDAPEKAFVRAWNLVVSKKLQYGAALRRRAETAGDALTSYRAREMLRLLDEVGKLAAFNYYFSLKALDHMELTPDGKLAVVFLSGIRLTI